VVWEGIYKPFGEAKVHPKSSVTNNFRFPGQYYDQETGLHYNYHRYYDPRTGRYLTVDPSRFMQPIGTDIPYLFPLFLTEPQKLIPYAYVQQNPINSIDIQGLVQGDCENGSNRDCIEECLDEYYGPLGSVAKSLSFVGAASAFVNLATSGALAGGEKVFTRAGDRAVTTSGRGGFAYIKGLPKAMTLRQAASGFAKAGTISTAVAIGATTFYATAYAYCWLECK
jgi:RHS repeat-associated protein